jgi:pSer/pThr/pTyr-binding forkhead associated (FHA) protein
MKLELISVDRQKAPIVLHQFPVIIGLDPGADVCLDDSAIGHYQCMIDDSEGVLTVWDLGTKLGTTINGMRISQKAVLMPGDELGFGKNRFVAHYGDDAADAPRRAGRPDSTGARRPGPLRRRPQPAGQL